MPARARRLPPRIADPEADLAQLVLAMSPEQLGTFAAALDPDDLSLLEGILAERHGLSWRSDPATMAHHLDPQGFQLYDYVMLLSRRFVDAAEGRSTRQIWNLPGRYGKSLLASQWGPVWLFDRRPAAKLMLLSYGDELALENADGVRTRLRAHADVLRCELRRDRQKLDRFVTNEGGGLLAAGFNSTITGFGVGAGGGMVIDDPMKNWQEAHSEAARLKVWNTFRGTLRNRLDEEEAFIIIVHHRMHEDDLTGRLVKGTEDDTGDAWEVTSLPALAVEGKPDPLGRAPGEPLEPARFPLTAVMARAKGMGSYLASALEQQDPSPEEGNELLREWFVLEETMPTVPDIAITSWDLKLKDRETGDYVVGQAWWRVGGGFWLVDQLRGRWDHGTTANAIALLAVRHPEVQQHVVESAGSADEVLPELRKARPGYVLDDGQADKLGMSPAERESVQALRRRGMTGLLPHPPKGDKSVRARTHIAPAAEAKDVHLDAHGHYVPHLLDELAAFPNGANDDQVDAMSQALQRLAHGTATVSTGAGRNVTPSMAPAAGVRVASAGRIGSASVSSGAGRRASIGRGRRPRA